MKLKHALFASAITCSLFLFVIWMGGYNFDERGPAQGYMTFAGVVFNALPWIIYLTTQD
jgi:hypothetical protein